MRKILFGIDGWRGVIVDDFIFENVKIVVQVIFEYVLENYENLIIIVGYDYRFYLENFVKVCVEVLSSNVIYVFFLKQLILILVLVYVVVKKGVSGVIMIIVSYNLYYYNGIKFILYYGGFVNIQIIDKIVKNVERI